MNTFIILAHYLESTSSPVEIADSLEEAEAAAFHHFHSLNQETDLCPTHYGVYARNVNGFFSTLVKEINV